MWTGHRGSLLSLVGHICGLDLRSLIYSPSAASLRLLLYLFHVESVLGSQQEPIKLQSRHTVMGCFPKTMLSEFKPCFKKKYSCKNNALIFGLPFCKMQEALRKVLREETMGDIFNVGHPLALQLLA